MMVWTIGCVQLQSSVSENDRHKLLLTLRTARVPQFHRSTVNLILHLKEDSACFKHTEVVDEDKLDQV